MLERGCHAEADQQQQQQCWGTRVRASQPRLTPQQHQLHQQWQRQHQQQQQGQPSVGPATSLSANRAYELYREFVWAGQWARFTVDQSNSSNSCCCSSQKKQNLRRKENIPEWSRNHQTKSSKSGSADQ